MSYEVNELNSYLNITPTPTIRPKNPLHFSIRCSISRTTPNPTFRPKNPFLPQSVVVSHGDPHAQHYYTVTALFMKEYLNDNTPMKPCSGGFIPDVWRGEGNGGTPAMLA